MTEIASSTVPDLSAHVLIVEDDPDMLRLLKIVFERRNFKVSTAQNGSVARDSVGDPPVDAVITDLMMPVMNGCELVEAIRSRQDNLSVIPILVLTGLPSSDPLVMRAQCQPDVTVILKPPVFSELPAQVHRLLGRG